jgi:hypothetical protein
MESSAIATAEHWRRLLHFSAAPSDKKQYLSPSTSLLSAFGPIPARKYQTQARLGFRKPVAINALALFLVALGLLL